MHRNNGMHRNTGSPRAHMSLTMRICILVAAVALVSVGVIVLIANVPPYKASISDSAHPDAVAASTVPSRTNRFHGLVHRPERRHSPSPVPSASAIVTNCVPAPADTMTNTVSHRCGFPDTTNTGVPAGVKLVNVPGQESSGPGWTYDSTNGVVVTRAGTVIDGLNIDGGIEIKASNVIVENSAITETGDWWGIGLYDSNYVTIKDCNISSPVASGVKRLQIGIKDVYGNTVGTHIIGNNIWHTDTAIQMSNGVIEGNYIHDYGYSDTGGNNDHLNGISVGGGDPRPLLIQHNTILNNHDRTDAIALFQDFGNESNKTINANLLAGGDYTIYGGGPDQRQWAMRK